VVLACLAIGWILTSITLREWMAFALALGAAAVIFGLRRRSGSAVPAASS
jgi:hypothetical protein